MLDHVDPSNLPPDWRDKMKAIDFDPFNPVLLDMVTDNLNRLADPYINVVNEYGDPHPVLEDAYLRQPKVVDRKLEFKEDPWWTIQARVHDEDKPAFIFDVSVAPVTKTGGVRVSCAKCGYCYSEKVLTHDRDSRDICRHVLAVLWDFGQQVKKGKMVAQEDVDLKEFPSFLSGD